MRCDARKFVREEQSVESLEFAVMLAVLVAAIIIAVAGLMLAITGRYGNTSTLIEGE
jgi:Flp pilus assembly pilin Flp